ncbi:MAG: acyl-CoA dehydrogenase family protein [Thiomonas sp.]
MSDFFQQPPVVRNRFQTDFALRYTVERMIPPALLDPALQELERIGQRSATEWPALGDKAESNPPRHVPFDAWGRRIDRIDVDPAFLQLVEIGQEIGLTALPYESAYGGFGRIVQAAAVQLFDPVSALASCPIVMTDGAARLLQDVDPELAARYVPRLTARTNGWTSGQWMTEKEGGSDVGRTSTIARELGDGKWALHGTKWFTSATTADIALALARPEGAEAGSRGLSLFLLELRRPDGSWNNIRVLRLKDKLGTKALPTAELELEGAVAVPVGGIGRGVAKIAGVLNVARVWAALGAVAGVGYLLDLARDYAQKREVLGARLSERPMHRAWLAQISAEYEAALALVFEAAAALGRSEHGEDEAGFARLLAPLTKLACARQSVGAVSELVESFGGAGYVEDTGIPRVLRNVQVHCIWEGTTSVLAADVIRAISKEPALGKAFQEDILGRLGRIENAEINGIAQSVRSALSELQAMMQEPMERDGRRIAWGMARTYQAALLCEAGDWRWRVKADRGGIAAARQFMSVDLIAPKQDASDSDLDVLAFGVHP